MHRELGWAGHPTVLVVEGGARVADVGCGHGASTLLMATAYPASTFVGFDYHDASIARHIRESLAPTAPG